MRRRGSQAASIMSSPVLIGALTVLVTIVAVFLAYNANQGLPFVPTYDLKLSLPNAANVVAGNDVREGGFRIGAVDKVSAVRRPDGTTYAVVRVKLQKSVEPLPVDSTLIVRARSALGLKYIEVDPGSASSGFQNGATLPLSAARPRPVELDEVLNTFDLKTRNGIKGSITGFGTGLAGRGISLNAVINDLPPLLDNLQPVAQNLAAPQTQLNRLVPALERTARLVAPVAQDQGSLFANLDTTFTALSDVARPFVQDTISKTPPTLDTAIANFPQQRPFLENTAAFARELRPGVAVLPDTVPALADALHFGIPNLKRAPAFNKQLEGVFRAVQRFSLDPNVTRGVTRLDSAVTSLNPTLTYVLPTQTVCNYATLFFRNIASLLSEGDSRGTWQRFIIIPTPQGPNSESGPSSAPADGPDVSNHLHANTYPNTAAPGQTFECETGNEDYILGKTIVGNQPGNQGTKTDGQYKGQGG
jgi:ABC-type transporter Mla subunit MlaD